MVLNVCFDSLVEKVFIVSLQYTTMDIEEPIFQPFPSDIVFQNFEPYQTYEVPLQLRNNDKVSASFQPIFISY